MRPRLVLFLCIVAACSAGPALASPPAGIRTPTRNITCIFVAGPPGHLLCAVRHAAYAHALEARCLSGSSLEWRGFALYPHRKASLVCSRGSLYGPTPPSFATLAYGRSWTRGPYTCSSSVEGLSCSNHAGRGLFLSRESWRRW